MCLKVEMKYNWKHKFNTPNKHCKVKKPTTLQANGLSQIESQELRPGWKWIMLGLSGLWYKDQKNDFSIESSAAVLNFPIECFMEGIKPVA